MKTEISVLEKLRKNVLPGISFFELILFSITITAGLILFIWQLTVSLNDSSETNVKTLISFLITLFDIPIGILAATWLSKRSKISPVLLAFDSILYGTTNFLAKNWALGIVNVFLSPVLWLFAFFYLWPKQDKENKDKEIKTKKLDFFSGLVIVGTIFFISTIFGLTSMFLINSNNELIENKGFEQFQIWFDSFSATLMLMAVFMGIMRYRETWYLYFAANFLKIILFSVSISQGKKEDMLLLVIALAYFSNTIFGMLIWKDSIELKIFKNKN